MYKFFLPPWSHWSSLYFQEPNDLNPLTRVGLFFRDESLKKALSIVVSPGQATGKVDEVLELLSRLDNQLIFILNYFFQRASKKSTASNYVFTYCRLIFWTFFGNKNQIELSRIFLSFFSEKAWAFLKFLEFSWNSWSFPVLLFLRTNFRTKNLTT